MIALPSRMVPCCLRQQSDCIRGCVTPKQIENLIESSGGDTDMVDGYDELPDEYQKKIDYALENHHVHDEDWNGVRPSSVTKHTCAYQLITTGRGSKPRWPQRHALYQGRTEEEGEGSW